MYRLVQQVRHALRSRSPAVWGAAGFLGLFSIPFIGAEIVVTGILLTMVPSHLVMAAMAIGITNVVFYHLLERPTLEGRGVLDGIDGFRSYIDGATDVAWRAGPRPEGELRTYQRLLPFAIALGLEGRWTEAFDEVLTPALVSGGGPEPFPWYRDRNGVRALRPASLASDLGTGLSSTLSSMSSPPSSGGSGGGFSGGGGSSGGGGGGGGGGGW